MSEICPKFFISTLPLRNRSGFETGSVMGSWPGGEQASGHLGPGDPVSLLRLGQWGVVGLQPQDGTARECGGAFPRQVELGAALVPSLAWHRPTGCSQELPPP